MSRNLLILLQNLHKSATEHIESSASQKLEFSIPPSLGVIQNEIVESRLLPGFNAEVEKVKLDQHELIVMEHAAKLAQAMSVLTGQALEIEAARLLSRQRQDFVATLTHDLKTPLVGVNNMLNMVAKGKFGAVNPQQIDILTEIGKSNTELLTLINTLNDVYLYEVNPNSICLADVDLVALCRDALYGMEINTLDRDISTGWDLRSESQQLLSMQLDSIGIRRLLDNLLSNAAKFADQGGNVSLSLDANQDQAILEVGNSGQSISDQERARLFQRFSQGASGQRHTGGSGLGLFLCRQIAELHGGTIECVNIDEGALFRVTLPIVKK